MTMLTVNLYASLASWPAGYGFQNSKTATDAGSVLVVMFGTSEPPCHVHTVMGEQGKCMHLN